MLFRSPGPGKPGDALGDAGSELVETLVGAITGADAYAAVRRAVHLEDGILKVGNRFLRQDRIREVAFLAAGNAAVPMAEALERVLGDVVTQGLLISPLPPGPDFPFQHMMVTDPTFPTREGGAAAHAALEMVSGLGERDLLIPLLSPGALGMLSAPPPGMETTEFRRFLEGVAQGPEPDLHLPEVVAALSPTQGGGLARAAQGARVEGLLVTRGGPGALLGGGPITLPIPRSVREVPHLLRRLGLWPNLPESVRGRLEGGIPLGGTPPAAPHSVVVAGPADALEEAGAEAAQRDHRPRLVEVHDTSPPADAARHLLEAIETYAAPGRGTKSGTALFQGLTLGAPEGGEDRDLLVQYLDAVHRGLRHRNVVVAALATVGSVREGLTPAGGVVDGRTPFDPGNPSQALDLAPGLTDVGLVAVGWVTPLQRTG